MLVLILFSLLIREQNIGFLNSNWNACEIFRPLNLMMTITSQIKRHETGNGTESEFRQALLTFRFSKSEMFNQRHTLSRHEVGEVPNHFTNEERLAKLVKHRMILGKKFSLVVFSEDKRRRLSTKSRHDAYVITDSSIQV